MRFFLLFLLLACSLVINAQKDSLVNWKVEAKQINTGTYIIKGSGIIADGWHLYAAGNAVSDSPDIVKPVEFLFADSNIKVSASSFSPSPKKVEDVIFNSANVFTDSIIFQQQIVIKGTVPANLNTTFSYFLGRDGEFIPAEFQTQIQLPGGVEASANDQRIIIPSINLKSPLANCGGVTNAEENSLFYVFLLGLLGGIIALLTPCVFPMIPVTVSFFTNRSSTRKKAIQNGVLYGIFIMVIYMLASVPFHLLGNVQPEIFNTISTNATLNIAFFIIFLVFAFSFFGFFEISLPSSFAGKTDSKGGLGSITGIFFMALTLAIVSFSCTGPILGSLLVGSIDGGAWQLTAGLAGFGLALGVPFALFAIFPTWMQALPKSGGWLDTVKKILAFLELALAFKFLSNADLVMHWGLLKREVFIAIWILISAGLALFLFGILRLPHDHKGAHISTPRKVIGIIAILFTLYLIPGLTQTRFANLHMLSGFPPHLITVFTAKTMQPVRELRLM